jgi:hypothetical protein
MTDIIRMAREVGLRSAVLLHMWGKEDALCDSEIEELRQIESFAALVAKEAERKASFDRAELWIKRINDAVLAEREACAKVCEAHMGIWIIPAGPEECAKAIRTRGTE